MIIRNLLFFIIGFSSLTAWGTHIIGGNFNIDQVGPNRFIIDLVVFRDCRTNVPNAPVPLADSLLIRIFDQSDISKFQDLFVLKNTPLRPQLGDDCFDPPNLCVEEYHLKDTLLLADNPAGYIAAMQVCCRNLIVDNILNPGATGITITAEIPDPALSGGNSTPHFSPYPDNGFLCLLKNRQLDFSANDPDGDSLHYELVTPYTSPAPTTGNPNPAFQSPPYNLVNWRTGYSQNAPIPGNPAMTIDPLTGELSITATQQGLFVFAYQVTEFRNGQPIGTVRRDIQLEVLNCVVNEPPVFEQPPQSAYTANTSEELCIPVRLTDPNKDDTMQLNSNYTLTIPELNNNPQLHLVNKSGTSPVLGRVCWQPDCSETLGGQQLEFKLAAISFGCDGTDTISHLVRVKIDPLPKDVLALMPNVFTPNGDDVNDEYKLQNELTYPCLSELEIRIFNRWGVEVYQNRLTDRFGWDGRYKGREAAPGVYFYTISGTYGPKQFEQKSFLTLVR
ncbi:MAG: gliding motility-associated C-terminal domain-containing protein [Owenweeksia sp.]|nr:gliding motility-associated C-terminal domain-containing protein [Owenweeksia sp.]